MAQFYFYFFSVTEIECPSTIPNGYIYSWCTMEAGNYCNDYICDNGYEATIPLTLKCNETGQWEWNKNLTEKLCTGKNPAGTQQ